MIGDHSTCDYRQTRSLTALRDQQLAVRPELFGVTSYVITLCNVDTVKTWPRRITSLAARRRFTICRTTGLAKVLVGYVEMKGQHEIIYIVPLNVAMCVCSDQWQHQAWVWGG